MVSQNATPNSVSDPVPNPVPKPVPGLGLSDPKLAFNLNAISDWSAALAFLDLMKLSRPFWAYDW
ncbi:hypothetical protein, partial [Stagnihabitans tardus]